MARKKITVITLQNVRNYGSVLQALATQHVLEEIGCDVDFVDYWKNGSDSVFQRLKEWTKGRNSIVKVLMAGILLPTFWQEDKIFSRFVKRHLNIISGRKRSIDDFLDFPITSDVYCTGSDQTWNSGWNNGILPELFLKFVPDGIRKISYSASFGKPKLDEWEKEETKRLLAQYDAISVRESTAVQICEELGIHGAVHLLDPTLQVNREFWMNIAVKRPVKESYILVYQLNTNPRFDRYVKEYAKRRGLKLVRFCLRPYQALRLGKSLMMPNPEMFISAIANAETLITDSFHGTAFACNLNTPMICIYPSEYSSRLDSLLKLLGLEHRHLIDYNDFSFVTETYIDFCRVNEILERERNKGLCYLKQAIFDEK